MIIHEIGHRCVISVSSRIKIGANCDLAPNVFIGNGTLEITPCWSLLPVW